MIRLPPVSRWLAVAKSGGAQGDRRRDKVNELRKADERADSTEVRCPICDAHSTAKRRSYGIAEVATHFVPATRDPARHERLRELLVDLWAGRDTVEIHRCQRCSFEFAVPWVAGDESFYNLVTESDPHYPTSRWEFRQTLEHLQARFGRDDSPGPLRLLEVGAGDGAFLRQLHGRFGEAFLPLATEYDHGAVAKLRLAGFETLHGAVQRLADDDEYRSRFEVICVFQALEHIADVHGFFGALGTLLREDGDIFVSVPYAPNIDLQEELVAYWDLPPNHVGRWTRAAFDAIARRHQLRVQDWELEPVPRIVSAWRLAHYAVLGKAYDERTIPGRVNALRSRWVRGPVKRLMAVAYMPRVLAAWPRLCPATQWVHLRSERPGQEVEGKARLGASESPVW